MKYIEFYKKFKEFPIISLKDVKNSFPDFDHRRFYEWQKKGFIKKIINNFYIFSEKEIKEPQINFIANKLREPSYLSLEYALNYYGFIPENVFLKTSVTTKRTIDFSTIIGDFSYQKMKKKLFFGYIIIKKGEISFKIACPEKAVLDFVYLRKDLKKENDFFELRLNKDIFKEKINKEKLFKYLGFFNNKSLEKKINILYKTYDNFE